MRVGIARLNTIVEKDALEMASKADTVIIAVGFNASSESEGGDRNFELPVGQEQLIEQIAALGKKTIVVIISGGSVLTSPSGKTSSRVSSRPGTQEKRAAPTQPVSSSVRTTPPATCPSVGRRR
jgi:hypothetical protein